MNPNVKEAIFKVKNIIAEAIQNKRITFYYGKKTEFFKFPKGIGSKLVTSISYKAEEQERSLLTKSLSIRGFCWPSLGCIPT